MNVLLLAGVASALLALVARFVSMQKKRREWKSFQTLRVVVDYDRPPEQLLADGGYDMVYQEIDSKFWREVQLQGAWFPIAGSGKREVEIILVDYGRAIESDEVIGDFASRSVRPADPFEILTLGATYPDLQRHLRIVALGNSAFSPLDSPRNVLELISFSQGAQREVHLYKWSHWPPDGYRFACVAV
ncbi:MAG: hypothetical protein QY311_00270 [Candidatus Paceibacterota bacterium]|nr:MAG: hypothetical protein QY311_00270 [Candidatus Paceibacterota bacterium]